MESEANGQLRSPSNYATVFLSLVLSLLLQQIMQGHVISTDRERAEAGFYPVMGLGVRQTRFMWKG